MINNINLNTTRNEYLFKENRIKKNPYVTFYRDCLFGEGDIFKYAMKLYEKEKDIEFFTKLVLENCDDKTTEILMQNLFSKGVIDIDNNNILEDLSNNSKLLNDIMK